MQCYFAYSCVCNIYMCLGVGWLVKVIEVILLERQSVEIMTTISVNTNRQISVYININLLHIFRCLLKCYFPCQKARVLFTYIYQFLIDLLQLFLLKRWKHENTGALLSHRKIYSFCKCINVNLMLNCYFNWFSIKIFKFTLTY